MCTQDDEKLYGLINPYLTTGLYLYEIYDFILLNVVAAVVFVIIVVVVDVVVVAIVLFLMLLLVLI